MINKFEAPKENKQEEPSIEIVTPVGAEGRKIGKEEIDKAQKTIEELEFEKEIKEKQKRGELLSQEEAAKLRELGISRKLARGKKQEQEENKSSNKSEKEPTLSEKNQEEIKRAFPEEEVETKTESETETKPEPETKTGEETKEINSLVSSRFESELNIKKEDLEKIEGFKDLSPGQQFLVLENLKQATLKTIHEEGLAKSKEEIANAKFLGRIWKGISKKYQIFKLEKATAKEIKEGGIDFYKENLEQLVKGIREFGTEVEMKGGRLEIKYASDFNFENLNPKEQLIVNDFNKVATMFSRIPDEWSKETASKSEQKKYKEAKEKYEQVKKDILNLKAEKSSEELAALHMNVIEKGIMLNQLLNTHPEFEEELKKIEDEKIWKKVLKSVATERGIYAGAGFLTRTATVSLIGFMGVPLAAAGMGGFLARKRAKETLKEREIGARRGEEDKSEEAKDFVDAEYLHESIDFLVKELSKDNLSEDKRDEMLRSLNFHIKDAQDKIENGTVNYGKKDVRLFNQYELIKEISSGIVILKYFNTDLNEEKYNKDLEVINKFLKKEDKKISRAQKKYINDKMINGVLLGAGFATAGYAIRQFGEAIGWWDDQTGISKKPEKLTELKEEIVEQEEKIAIEETSNFLESKVAQKGDSPLSLAKKMYIENAEKLGYKESMGDINKWAEKFSTRHIVGQYISEHQGDYKDLIDKVGVPPKDLVELDKWISKVPAKTFNEVLNNKVPNLIHIGDIININNNGDINISSPEGKLRIGHLDLEFKKDALNTTEYKGIMSVEDISKISPEKMEKINELFSKYLVASFEGFKSFSPEEQMEKINELNYLSYKLALETDNNPEIRKSIEEIDMVKEIWKKFIYKDLELEKKLPEPVLEKEIEIESNPIPDETGSNLKGETPLGSEENVRRIRGLFEKEGGNEEAIDELVKQTKSGKINKEDFKAFLIDEARKDDNFVSESERVKINNIMSKIK